MKYLQFCRILVTVDMEPLKLVMGRPPLDMGLLRQGTAHLLPDITQGQIWCVQLLFLDMFDMFILALLG